MSPVELPVRWRPRAIQDVERAAWQYRESAGRRVARRFVERVRSGVSEVGREREAGSPQHGIESGLAGLRTWPLNPFPYLVFYFVHASTVEIVRVLLARRDVQSLVDE